MGIGKCVLKHESRTLFSFHLNGFHILSAVRKVPQILPDSIKINKIIFSRRCGKAHKSAVFITVLKCCSLFAAKSNQYFNQKMKANNKSNQTQYGIWGHFTNSMPLSMVPHESRKPNLRKSQKNWKWKLTEKLPMTVAQGEGVGSV